VGFFLEIWKSLYTISWLFRVLEKGSAGARKLACWLGDADLLNPGMIKAETGISGTSLPL
jgi:hypothetical protein